MTDTLDMAKSLQETVIDGGFCIGCGACAAVEGSPFSMGLDPYGQMVASIDDGSTDGERSHSLPVVDVCPFSQDAASEDEIADDCFGKVANRDERVGRYHGLYAGFVSESDYHERGSSGGMGSWILAELLREELVDYVIHVSSVTDGATDELPFAFRVSSNVEDVRNGAKSRYYPVEMSRVLSLIREQPGRYALIGVPCFIKAVRLMARNDSVIAERLSFAISLVCGHLKSTRFADFLAWQVGIEPCELREFDFRHKLDHGPANKYAVRAADASGRSIVAKKDDLHGTDWGLGYFKYKACDYCDDVFGETADLTIGDAWLPEYVKDSLGTNIVITRNSTLTQLIDKAMDDGRLRFDRITADRVIESQSSSLFHRRQGLSYRLWMHDQRNSWRPPKRVRASRSVLPKRQRRRIELRAELSEASHRHFDAAVKASNFDEFNDNMRRLVDAYRHASRPRLHVRVVRGLARRFRSILNQIQHRGRRADSS